MPKRKKDDEEQSLLKTVIEIYKLKGLWVHFIFFIIVPAVISILTIVFIANGNGLITSVSQSNILFLQTFLPISIPVVATLGAISTAGVILLIPKSKNDDFEKFLYDPKFDS